MANIANNFHLCYGGPSKDCEKETTVMTTLNISLPDPMKAFIEAQVQSGAYASASDYVRALVREAQKRQAQEELEAKLLAALDSNDFAEMTPAMFERIRERIRQQQHGSATP